jgi:hypothetical protein
MNCAILLRRVVAGAESGLLQQATRLRPARVESGEPQIEENCNGSLLHQR